jgi:hypothetical protein
MSEADQPAFPGIKYNHNQFDTPNYEEHVPGLTKREYFAGLAMQSLASRTGHASYVAKAAVELADKMIEELNKKLEEK